MRLALIISIFSFSCSHISESHKLSSSKIDTFRKDSFSRFSYGRLIEAKDNSDNKALVHCYMGKTEEAIKNIRMNYFKSKGSYAYWNSIGTCYLLVKDYPKAKFFYRLALQHAMKNSYKSHVFNNLALLAYKKDEFNESLSLLKKARNLNKRSKLIQYNMAQLYIHFNEYKLANSILLNLYKENSNDIDIISSLAMIYSLIGNPRLALNYYKKIPQEYLSRADIAIYMAFSFFQLGSLADALRSLQRSNNNGDIRLKSISKSIESIINKKIEESKKKG